MTTGFLAAMCCHGDTVLGMAGFHGNHDLATTDATRAPGVRGAAVRRAAKQRPSLHCCSDARPDNARERSLSHGRLFGHALAAGGTRAHATCSACLCLGWVDPVHWVPL